ncbi:MAG TPA: amidohydrolase family protein, partial [Bryobacteraceae bacterium]|nr:amidohydrolase family protein [Bryobacteraceae bacterium]
DTQFFLHSEVSYPDFAPWPITQSDNNVEKHRGECRENQAGVDCEPLHYIDHYDTSLEFTLMARAGMNFQQILASLTTNPARKFGYSGRTGRVAKGMEADLAILAADPAQDATAFSKVRYTIRSGKVIYPGR